MKVKPKQLSQFKVVTYEEALAMGPKRFVREVLFPFMRREAGRGFAMDRWIEKFRKPMEMDEVERKPPVCGTAACIGGSISLLTGHKGSTEKLGALLGLNENQADVLFYHWNDERCWDSASWPLDIKDDFAAANTPVKKERVAERMIKRALKDPSCLDPQ